LRTLGWRSARLVQHRLVNATARGNRSSEFSVILNVVRTRRFAFALVAISVGPAACSSGGGNHSTPTSAARAATTVAGVTGFEKGRNFPLVSASASSTTVGTSTPNTATAISAVCNGADLAAHGAKLMPTPMIVTRHIGFSNGPVIDPPSSTRPAISAKRAWGYAWGFTNSRPSPLATYELLLGDVTSSTVNHRLVWLIVGEHMPIHPISSGPARLPGDTTLRHLCYFSQLLMPVDANTGRTLFIATGGSQER